MRSATIIPAFLCFDVAPAFKGILGESPGHIKACFIMQHSV
jgi:hypothetical protein